MVWRAAPEVALTEKEIEQLYKLRFYLTDDEVTEAQPLWIDWLDNRCCECYFSAGSSSFSSGRRYIWVMFKDHESAALFRVFFGGEDATKP